jgi:uncharacterized protein (DUF58 family)
VVLNIPMQKKSPSKGANQPAESLRLRAVILPILVFVLALLQLAVPNKVWAVLLVGFAGVWLIAWLWARSLSRNLHLIREVRFGWAQVGDLLEERFSLRNEGRFPGIWVEMLDRSTMPSYNPSCVTGVGIMNENHWQTQGECKRRGVYTLGPTSIVSGDPFGIYSVEKHYPAYSTMVVMPPVLPLPMIEVAPGGRAGEGIPRADAPERTVDAASVRDYQPGDSLRWIHWKTSARKGSLYVRLFDGAPVGDWWIFLDLDASCQAGREENSTIEHAVVLAASLASRAMTEGRTFGLVAQAGESLFWMPPREGATQFWDVLRALAVVTPGARPLGDLLCQMHPREGARSSLILITPDVGGRWLEALLPLARRGLRPTVLLLDPASYGGEGSAEGLSRVLADLEITRYVIKRDFLDRPELHPGIQHRLKWRVTPLGRAFPSGSARDMSWKTLS